MTSPELVIRRASRADVDLVLSAGRLFASPPTAEWTQDFLDRGSNLLLLALDDQTPVGMLVAVETSHLSASPDLFVYGIRVREDFRGRRLAHRLVDKAVEIAEEAGCSKVWGSVHRSEEQSENDLGVGAPISSPSAAGAGGNGGPGDGWAEVQGTGPAEGRGDGTTDSPADEAADTETEGGHTRATTFVIPIP